MAIRQLLSHPQPYPSPERPLPQQQERITRSQIMELHPFPPNKPTLLLSHPLSHPHPQFVAAKSLMLNPPKFIYNSSYEKERNIATKNFEENDYRLIKAIKD
jgi:hypothetical protein